MRHVFVETNWVVDWAAPAHHERPSATALLDRAASGDLQLHLPAICLVEARHPIRRKFQPRSEADAIRRFLPWARQSSMVTDDDVATVRRVLDQFESVLKRELELLLPKLESLRKHPGVTVYALDESMLERAISFTSLDLGLKPIDQAILAAVLGRAQQLRAEGETDLQFCVLDQDLSPRQKNGEMKQPLGRLYDELEITVRADFEVEQARD